MSSAPESLVHPLAIDSLMYYASRAPYGAIVEIGVYDDYMVGDCPGCTQALHESPYRILVATETGKALVIV